MHPDAIYADAVIQCTDMSKSFEKEGWQDALTVAINSQEFIQTLSLYEYQ